MKDQVGISAPAQAPQAVPDSGGAGLRNVKANPRPIRIPFARLVRWRFDYFDHKRTKTGQWCRPGELQSDMAAFQSKENLRRACIEVKEALSARTYVLVECDGADFVNFAWVAGSPVGSALNGSLKQERTLRSQIVGLTLVTRDLKVTVLIDGSHPTVAARSDAEKSQHLAGFGK